jgi:hypothetical protein
MKSQKFNEGELVELNVNIEKEIVEVIKVMAVKANRSIDDIVTIALRRYRACHAELENKEPGTD